MLEDAENTNTTPVAISIMATVVMEFAILLVFGSVSTCKCRPYENRVYNLELKSADHLSIFSAYLGGLQ